MQQGVVVAVQQHEFRIPDTRRELSSFVERVNAIIAGMNDQCPDGNLGQQVRDIEIVDGGSQDKSISGETVWACSSASESICSLVRSGMYMDVRP